MEQSNELSLHLDATYIEFLNNLKSYISKSRVRAAVVLNKEVIQMYWQIGKDLVEKGKVTDWGDKLLFEEIIEDKHGTIK